MKILYPVARPFALLCFLAFVPFIVPANDILLQEIQYTFRTFQNPDKSFGYEIFKGKKKFIVQEHIPARPGNAGFKTAKDAEKVAKLVISKLERGISPPSVSEEELRALGI